MRFILIGNYPPDKQESMERFAQMMAVGLRQAGYQADIWRPRVIMGRWSNSTTDGLGKWLGYIDKWLIFMGILYWRRLINTVSTADQPIHYHVCDHSNSAYLKPLPISRVAITCHDVLAIRGALGHADAHSPASSMGKLLQRWIIGNLSQAQRLAAVSNLTLKQLRELVPEHAPTQDWRVIHNAFNADFSPLPSARQQQLLAATDLPTGVPFLLHVGSGLPRKNRALLLRMVHALGEDWPVGLICFAGEELEPALYTEAQALGLAHRVVSIVKPDHSTLVALYNACVCFIFPSFSEGFGWPVIEAQACGAPVIASANAPMPEVSGEAALHADPRQPTAWAAAFRTLLDPATRARVVAAGYQNSQQFALTHMIDAYLALHRGSAA